MAIALGQFEGLRGLVFTENWPLSFYDHLPDVDVSFDDVPQLMGENGMDKEVFYEMDCDVHLMDPNFIGLLDDDWEAADFEEISTNIGPIIGNSIRRRNEDWHDYPYYTLYEAFEKIADVFQQRERYAALKEVHDDLLSAIRSDLPSKEDRPTVGLLSVNSDFENGAFYAYPVHEGNGHKQYRDLRMRGAFDDVIEGSYAEWDYEQILEVDPDALLFQYGFSHVSTEEFERRMDAMRKDPVGQQLSAVQNDRLYRGGTSYQGPIINLFQTEAAAKQFYPETFGEWNGLDTLADESERLFDYRRVADIVDGTA
jgi:iron complex transport system substrate-binding protein